MAAAPAKALRIDAKGTSAASHLHAVAPDVASASDARSTYAACTSTDTTVSSASARVVVRDGHALRVGDGFADVVRLGVGV